MDVFEEVTDEETKELQQRLSKAFMAFNSDAHTHANTGTLIQAWLPKADKDGKVHLETKGLPVSIYGMGAMLAQFRYMCCGRRFSADNGKPESMGIVGRVFAIGQPEIYGDVQEVGAPAFLRGSEAAKCDVHSACALPVFLGRGRSEAVAVVELLWHDKDIPFAEAISRLQSCLETVSIYTPEMDLGEIRAHLRTLTLDEKH